MVDFIFLPQRWSRGHKTRGQGHKKNPRPRTAFPRTDTQEAKDRNARGQGPRTQAQVLSKKKVFTKIFQAISTKNFFQKLFQALHKILTIQKVVQSSSRGQANFRGLGASRPKPRTSKCVLEAKDVLEDSTSVKYLCSSLRCWGILTFKMELNFSSCWYLSAQEFPPWNTCYYYIINQNQLNGLALSFTLVSNIFDRFLLVPVAILAIFNISKKFFFIIADITENINKKYKNHICMTLLKFCIQWYFTCRSCGYKWHTNSSRKSKNSKILSGFIISNSTVILYL